MTQPVLIMAGGTGGHVFPALAVAKSLQEKGIDVVWMGTRRGIESRLVPEAGFKIEWLDVHGLRGKSKLGLLLAPFQLLRALLQSMQIILKVKPAVVLGMGGFVSGPGGLMAAIFRKPLVLHEQNAIPGMTNRILSRLASVVLESFPGSFKHMKKLRLVGNPVRKEILALHRRADRVLESAEGLNLLVVGGSLGALALNETVPAAMRIIADDKIKSVWHQTGVRFVEQTEALYMQTQVQHKVEAFIENMAEAYEWADLVICRAGAMTVSELAAAGVPSILVPYPYAVDDHQTFNARYLADNDAAILISQQNLSASKLKDIIDSLDRNKLYEMSNAAYGLAKPGATDEVVDVCLQQGGLA